MSWNFNPMAGPWLATHVWEYYDYTKDLKFLKETGYELIKSSANFTVDYLWHKPDGTYTAAPSTSPEHGPIDQGATFVHAVVREILLDAIQASKELGIDKKERKQWEHVLANLVPYKIGRYGQLLEWSTDIDDPKDEHRHVNHLFGLHPGHTVSPITTPELAEAAKVVLVHRGDGATGWSMGWKMNLWARALDGDHARKILNNALAHSNGGAGVFYNLFDSHAPFQIDGNFGACAGIAEMIMQSNSGLIRILPALPSAWTEGHMHGMKAVGDVTVSIDWKNGEATRVELTNNQGQTMRVHYKNLAKAKVYVDNVLTEVAVKDNVATLTGANGSVVVLDFDGSFTPTGIDAVKTEAAHDGYIYNVSGQRVNDSYKGLIIKNGKKMLKK